MSALPRRPSSKSVPGSMASAGQFDFPALFTIDGSNRHEVIVVNPGHDLDDLKRSIETLIPTSPNCAQVLSKYQNKDVKETIGQIRVRWAYEGRDKQLFPRETILTEENCEPVLRMMAIGVGKDVFDVKMETKHFKNEGKKEEEK